MQDIIAIFWLLAGYTALLFAMGVVGATVAVWWIKRRKAEVVRVLFY